MSAAASATLNTLLETVRARATAAGVFGAPRIHGGVLVCPAPDASAPAEYRVLEDASGLWVGLYTADRWLSQSIEQDLVHTGDKLEDLMEEELADQGERRPETPPRFEHFRDDDRVFTFRVRLPFGARDASAAERATRWLLACEAMFRRLGDMEGAEDE